MNRPNRPSRQRRVPAERKQDPAPRAPTGPQPFCVLVAAHRPAYRARVERAVEIEGWEVRSLLNREDPIGLINCEAPDLFIISVDAERNANVGYLRAAQRFRAVGLRIVALFEDAEQAADGAEQCDVALSWPWRSADVRAVAARMFEEKRGAFTALPKVDRDRGE